VRMFAVSIFCVFCADGLSALEILRLKPYAPRNEGDRPGNQRGM
jgi:hypothetical protein